MQSTYASIPFTDIPVAVTFTVSLAIKFALPGGFELAYGDVGAGPHVEGAKFRRLRDGRARKAKAGGVYFVRLPPAGAL